MTFHPHRYQPKKPNKYKNAFSRPLTLGDLAFGGGGFPSGYGVGTAKKLSRAYMRSKKKPSRTTTSLNQRAEQDGNGGSFSKFFYGRYALKMPMSVKQQLAHNYRLVNSAAQATSTAGFQQITPVATMFNSTDINTFSNAGPGQNVVCFGVRCETIFTNATNATVRITLYDIVARKDINNSSVNTPDLAWKQGEADDGGNSTSYNIVGVTPFSSKSFTEFFKIKKITHVLLGQGATHIHRVNFFPNRQISYGAFNYGAVWKDLTCYTMMVSHGQVSDAITGGGGASIGASKINYVQVKEYETGFLSDASTTFSSGNTLPTSFTGGENLISIGAGLVEAEVAA
jgi:hypothetical protein